MEETSDTSEREKARRMEISIRANGEHIDN